MPTRPGQRCPASCREARCLAATSSPICRPAWWCGRAPGNAPGQHQSEGVFGNGNGIAAGSIHHHDAALGGCIEVNVVDAYARAPDDAQLGGLVHHGRINKCCRATNSPSALVAQQRACLFRDSQQSRQIALEIPPERRVKLFQRLRSSYEASGIKVPAMAGVEHRFSGAIHW